MYFRIIAYLYTLYRFRIIFMYFSIIVSLYTMYQCFNVYNELFQPNHLVVVKIVCKYICFNILYYASIQKARFNVYNNTVHTYMIYLK